VTPANAAITADVLEAGADLIENVGHCRGTGRIFNNKDEVIAYCLTGSISQAAANLLTVPRQQAEHYSWAVSAVQRELADRYSGNYNSTIPHWWNDHRAKNSAEVVDLMRHTAKNLRNQAGEQA
jgi:hypothetical protein